MIWNHLAGEPEDFGCAAMTLAVDSAVAARVKDEFLIAYLFVLAPS